MRFHVVVRYICVEKGYPMNVYCYRPTFQFLTQMELIVAVDVLLRLHLLL